MSNTTKVARKIEITAQRGNIYDVAINGKYAGSVVKTDAGYCDGFNFHDTLHGAVNSLANLKK